MPGNFFFITSRKARLAAFGAGGTDLITQQDDLALAVEQLAQMFTGDLAPTENYPWRRSSSACRIAGPNR